MTRGWPVRLSDGPVGLRPIERRDSGRWQAIRAANREWLQRWESTPPRDAGPPVTFTAMVRRMRREAKEGRQLPFVVTYDRELVGQLTVGGITYGSLWSALPDRHLEPANQPRLRPLIRMPATRCRGRPRCLGRPRCQAWRCRRVGCSCRTAWSMRETMDMRR